MARLPRLVLPGHPHLAILRVLEGHVAFADAVDRQAFVAALREAAANEQVQLHAYALLPDEARLLLTPPTPQALARLMQAIGRTYVSAYNRRHGRSGTLWNGRYRCAVIEPGEAGLEAQLWVEGASAEPGVTSAAHHTGEGRDSMLVDLPAYWALGNTPFEREAQYRNRLALGLSEACARSLRHATRGGWAVGSASFAAAASAASGRASRPRPQGRPSVARRAG
jgi:putative transposase